MNKKLVRLKCVWRIQALHNKQFKTMAGRKEKKILKTMVITALLNIVKTESVSSMLRKTVITIVFNNFFSFLPAVVLKVFVGQCLYSCKPDQFHIQIKVYFFSNLWFCPSFKSLLLLLQLLLLLLPFFFFFYVLFCYYISFSLFSNAKISLTLLFPLPSLSIF